MISISGNTASNIAAAAISSKSVTITTVRDSKLGRACSEVILLDYPCSGVFTARSTSFLASALTCISLVCKIKIPNAKRIYTFTKAVKIAFNEINSKNSKFKRWTRYMFDALSNMEAKA